MARDDIPASDSAYVFDRQTENYRRSPKTRWVQFGVKFALALWNIGK